jgi:rhodanese-related sulfurtransferase
MRTVILIVIAVAVALIILGVLAYQYAVNSPYRISSQVAKQMVNANQVDVVLDVRTDVERATLGFYPGSVHIQSVDLEAKMPQLYPNKDVRILAYCNTGHRARMATDKLHALGYTNSVYIATQYTSLL